MKKIAVYAGTFDPPTLGHLWVIQQASMLFDEVIVALGINPEKKTTFSVEDRLEMLKHAVSSFPNVRVEEFENEYLVHYAASIKANFIIRGIRNNQDFEYERALRHINSKLEPSIMTLFLMPPKDIAEVSSSLVKGLIGPHGWETVVGSLVPIATLAKILNSQHTVWENLLAYGAVGDSQDFWYNLIEGYTHEDRAYHTLDHIGSMLRDFNKVKHLLKDPLSVEVSIWFHDYHYETKSSYPKNEEVSAILAGKTIQYLGLPDNFNQKVQNLILATKHSFTPTDNDSQYLVDIDLAILGQTEAVFDAYEEAIRKEYAHVPEEIYVTERTKILKQFLDRPAIYSTKYFRSDYEDIARKNIERSIKNLNG